MPLGNGPENAFTDGRDPGDYVAVVTRWKMPNPFEGATAAQLLKAQKVVASGGPWRLNNQAKDWVGKPIAEAYDLDPSDKVVKARLASMIRTWIDNGAFVIVPGKTESAGRSGTKLKDFVEVGEWADD